MRIRDEEIKKLINYAKSLGLKVYFDSKGTDACASWAIDGSSITIFTKNNKNKLSTILSLHHEISHHLYHVKVNKRKIDQGVKKAVNLHDKNVENKVKTPILKKHRNNIFRFEKNSAQFWPTVYKETQMKFPYWKLLAQMEIDVWYYDCWAKSGMFPDKKSQSLKLKQVSVAYKKMFATQK